MLGTLSSSHGVLPFFVATNVGGHQKKKKLRKTLSRIALSVGGEDSVGAAQGTAEKCRRGAREAPAAGSPCQGFPVRLRAGEPRPHRTGRARPGGGGEALPAAGAGAAALRGRAHRQRGGHGEFCPWGPCPPPEGTASPAACF